MLFNDLIYLIVLFSLDYIRILLLSIVKLCLNLLLLKLLMGDPSYSSPIQ